MDSRREFLKKAALLSGGAAFMNALPPVIQRALAINPELGSSFYDAEHIVFLMQENRSFDHVFGSLQGVRGFNDPRAIELSNKNKVWLQSDKDGNTYLPFHLDIKDTKVAWMGSLPHNWTDQTDARNEGKYDRWLEVKKTRNKDYPDMPLTLGYCDRSDFPFYYSLADAFTVCDQHFSSSITGTHSNRHYWMTGSNREIPADFASKAHVWNVTNYNTPELAWKTYPERLEENGISWKVYQNELYMGFGLKDDDWLSNFGTNVLEYFSQYHVRLEPGRIANLQIKKDNIQALIDSLEKSTAPGDAAARKLAAARKVLAGIEADQNSYTMAGYESLSDLQKRLNDKAFTINSGDPYYHELTPLAYDDHGAGRSLDIPKGDILHQFRQDVENGTLPTVSWLMPPANFSDHPSAPWFGPWYVSEVMEILLKNPEVWKKTVFILTYDENDGYFDHAPPFVVPNPYKENTGKVSEGIDPRLDFATKDQQTNPSATADGIRESAIGLGYRVPMVIVSPWTRGGYVCSEIFDHTSSLQFLETFLAKKFSKNIEEENITRWRRTICGDLGSAFRPYHGESIDRPVFVEKIPFIESIHQAQFRQIPDNYKKLTPDDIAQINKDPLQSPYFPRQEKGIRPACALPYELYADGVFNKSKNSFAIIFKAGNAVFGVGAAGSPFSVYAVAPYQSEPMRTWDYAAAAGDSVQDVWSVDDFEHGRYHLRVYGPNGFYREFTGNGNHPPVQVICRYEPDGGNTATLTGDIRLIGNVSPTRSLRLTGNRNLRLTGNVKVTIVNHDMKAHTVVLHDNSYKTGSRSRVLAAGGRVQLLVDLSKTYNWYDFSIRLEGYDAFEERFAGHVETGKITKTDPLMGGVI
jgi:phospholipase C